MSSNMLHAAKGTDLIHLAAQIYRDATAWTLIARANGLIDPVLQDDKNLVIPAYNKGRANDGILASQ